MLLALGAAGSLVDALSSLTSSQSSSATTSTNPTPGTANPFDLGAGAQSQISSSVSTGSAGPTISPQTMSALIQAQSQSGTTNTAPTDPSAALQDLFSRIDSNGDGAISQQEFENALGAGGTNIAAADNVFNQLSNGTGSVTLDDLKSALQGAGHHGGHHHMHVGGAGDSVGSTSRISAEGSTDAFMQALQGASSTTVTNSDGSTTTSITYADGSKVTMTTPAASSSSNSTSGSATSSYNWIEQMIQREAQSLSASLSSSLSVSA